MTSQSWAWLSFVKIQPQTRLQKDPGSAHHPVYPSASLLHFGGKGSASWVLCARWEQRGGTGTPWHGVTRSCPGELGCCWWSQDGKRSSRGRNIPRELCTALDFPLIFLPSTLWSHSCSSTGVGKLGGLQELLSLLLTLRVAVTAFGYGLYSTLAPFWNFPL